MRLCQLLSIALLLVSASRPVFAGTYVTSLNPSIETGASGEYLAANFDFGIEFSHVESVKLEFILPNGFQGYAVATGNSFYSRHLIVQVDDGYTQVDSLAYALSDALGASPLSVPTGVLNEYDLRPRTLAFGPPPPTVEWPNFIYSGNGRVSFVGIDHSTYNPLQEGAVPTSTIRWHSPGPIESLRLTVIGTPVPEPNFACLVFVAFVFICFKARLGNRAFANCLPKGLS